jgi:hypothetical protein
MLSVSDGQVPRFGSKRAHGAGARILHQSRPLLNPLA